MTKAPIDKEFRVESIMHAGLARLVVVIEKSWADSLSDAVSQSTLGELTQNTS